MEAPYLQRWLTPSFLLATRENPVVVLTGARQVGKSTFLEHCLPKEKWRYLTLDNLDVLDQANRDPAPLFADPAPLIIDEVQRAPEMLLAVKRMVDRARQARRFVLSGSANLLLMQKVSESLAGRAVFCHLEPFTLGEWMERSLEGTLSRLFSGKKPEPDKKSQLLPKAKLLQRIWDGFLPVVTLEKRGDSATRWLEGYVTSYLERDLRQLSQIDSLADFRRLMSALALRSGSLLNQTEIGRDIGMKQPTCHRYLNLLEVSQLFNRVPAYSVNRTKRLMKTPKGYFFDSGLAAFLAGRSQGEDSQTTSFLGALFETAVFQHLRVWKDLQVPKANLYYWRTMDGLEVDFVVEWGRKLLAIEAKATDQPQFSHAQSLRVFLQEYPETSAGIIIHTGNQTEQLDEHIFAVPISNAF